MSNELERVLAMRRGEVEPDHLSSAPEEMDVGDSASMLDAGSSIAPVDSPLLQFLDLCGQYNLKSEEEEEEVLKEVKARVEADPTLVNARDDVGNSALSFAAFAGNPKIVYLLVQKGASVNTSNSVNGWTPFISALYQPFLAEHITIVSVLLGAPKQRVEVWAVDTLKSWSGLDYLLAWEGSMSSCCDAGFRDAYDVKDFCEECVEAEMDGKVPPTPQAWFAAKGGAGAGGDSSDTYPCGEALAAIRKVVSLVAGAVGVPPSVFFGAKPGTAKATFDAHIAAKARGEVEAQALAASAAKEKERSEAAALAVALMEEKERVRRREMDRTALDAQAAKRVVLAASLAVPSLQQQQPGAAALYTISPNIAAATAAAAAAAAASSLSGGGEAGKKKGVEGGFIAPPHTTSTSTSSSSASTTFVNQSNSSWVIKSTPPIMPFPYLSNSIVLLAFLGVIAATWCMGGRLYDLPMGTA